MSDSGKASLSETDVPSHTSLNEEHTYLVRQKKTPPPLRHPIVFASSRAGLVRPLSARSQ